MVRSAHPRAPKKTAKPYHHRNLRRALPDAALRTIQTHGVKHLTLRTVGTEGFRKLRQTLADAWEQNGRGRVGFDAMGKAYVQFAVKNPSHYRVMFGGFIESAAKDDQFVAEAKAAFQVLVDALVEQQNTSDIRRDDPMLMARFVWALVHGTAMLFIDGQLAETVQREPLEHYVFERLYESIR